MDKIKKTLLFLVMVVLGLTSISAKNYIAAVDGTSGGAGTLASPYDIPTAISKAIAGDTVFIRGGQYMLNSRLNLSKGGTSTAFISIIAYPGDDRPVLDFFNNGYSGTNASSERGIYISKDYYYICGLDITRAGDNGMNVNSSHNKIQNCRFYKNCDTGLQITGGTGGYNVIIDCDSHDNFDYKSNPIGGNADGFACKLTVGVGNQFIRCRSWNNSDDGYDCYGTQNDIYFEDCWVMTNGQKSYDVSDYPGVTTETVVTNQGNGNGFKVGGNASPGGATLIRCISIGHKIMSTSNKGFDQNNGIGQVFCYNCLSYNDGRGFSFPNNVDSRGANIFANNISLSSGSNSFGAGTIFQTNTWNGIPVSTSDFESVAVDSSKVERNADGSLPYMGGLFRLVENSGLIDKGTDISFPYSGLAPDLGPFEYTAFTSLVALPASHPQVSIKYFSLNQEIKVDGIITRADVYQINGVRLFSRQITTNALSIQTNNWPKGVYIVRTIAKNGASVSKKVMIN